MLRRYEGIPWPDVSMSQLQASCMQHACARSHICYSDLLTKCLHTRQHNNTTQASCLSTMFLPPTPRYLAGCPARPRLQDRNNGRASWRPSSRSCLELIPIQPVIFILPLSALRLLSAVWL
jgi:hypothetical protein